MVFGPITLLWFAVMAVGGTCSHRRSIRAFSLPSIRCTACQFPRRSTVAIGFVVLGAVFLAVTGAEALYADLGHFGRTADPVRLADVRAARTCVELYRAGGPGAGAPRRQSRTRSSCSIRIGRFFRSSFLATMATIIASQAVITGRLFAHAPGDPVGPAPATDRHHTSVIDRPGRSTCRKSTPCFCSACCCLSFYSAPRAMLATAYGIAVTGTMVTTVALAFIVVWKYWRWPRLGRRPADRCRSSSSTRFSLAQTS